MMGKRTLFGMVAILAIVGTVLVAGGPKERASLAGARAPVADGPSAEGITVHGHWKLDIFDADGSYDRSVEFQNALTPGGAGILAQLLGRDRTPGAWEVWLLGSPQPCNDGTAARVCVITENPDSGGGLSHVFDNLTLDLSAAGELTLAGSATIAQATEINEVQTIIWHCTPGEAPAPSGGGTCPAIHTSGFTRKTTSEAGFDSVPVDAGQVVQVFVTLSFS